MASSGKLNKSFILSLIISNTNFPPLFAVLTVPFTVDVVVNIGIPKYLVKISVLSFKNNTAFHANIPTNIIIRTILNIL